MIPHCKFIFLLLVILLFSSCSHYYYAPDEANVLKLSEANDIKVSVSGNNQGESYELKHVNFQAGYSPIKHLGIFGSHFRMSGKEPSDSPLKSGRGHLTNVGIGGYYFLDRGSILDRIVKYDEEIAISSGFLIDIYGGYGMGNIHNSYIEGGNSNLDFQKYFLQGGLHWKGAALGFSFVYKFGKLNYFNGVINGQLSSSDIASIMDIREFREFPFRESSLHFYMGIRHARVYLNISTVANIFDSRFTYRTSLGSFGIVMEIDEIFRSIKQNKE